MVCIAAFLILIILGIIVAILSIFKPNLWKKYLKLLKKAWHCFSRRITFRKCDTSFSDDVKTLLLKKVVIKKPKLVKPISILVEIGSIAIVVVTIWSLAEAAKAGLALWVFGTCNVSQPSNCALGSEICSLEEEDLNWFEEWGEIFKNIPDRLRTWDATDYLVEDTPSLNPDSTANAALDIMDSGCSVCMQSYKNQLKNTDFMNSHKVYILLYPIKLENGSYKFKNSGVITKYFHALSFLAAEDPETYQGLDLKILNRIFTESNADGDGYQPLFNSQFSEEEAAAELESWLKEWGLSHDERATVAEKAASEAVAKRMQEIDTIVETEILPKGIPTLIYNGKKHLGLFK